LAVNTVDKLQFLSFIYLTSCLVRSLAASIFICWLHHPCYSLHILLLLMCITSTLDSVPIYSVHLVPVYRHFWLASSYTYQIIISCWLSNLIILKAVHIYKVYKVKFAQICHVISMVC